MRVVLIPTGQMELRALAGALEKLFPDHDFETRASGRGGPFDGFTSSRIQLPLPRPNRLTYLVRQLASEVQPGRGDVPADLAILIDDLELENADQPEVVTQAVRDEIIAHVQAQRAENPQRANRLEKRLRERASFHLAAPMIESWLFADPGSLPVAGIPAERLPPKLVPDRDPEQLQTDDPDYQADDGSSCTALNRRNQKKRKKQRLIWLREDRDRHPKAYLAWLCRDPRHRKCSTYQESSSGAAALRALDWPAVLEAPEHMTYARALIADLASALGSDPLGFSSLTGEEASATSSHQTPRDRVLRNL